MRSGDFFIGDIVEGEPKYSEYSSSMVRDIAEAIIIPNEYPSSSAAGSVRINVTKTNGLGLVLAGNHYSFIVIKLKLRVDNYEIW